MRILSSFSGVTRSMAAVFILAGCDGGSQLAPSSSTHYNLVDSLVRNGERLETRIIPGADVIAHTDHGKSWVSAFAKNQKLLYISDIGTNDVNIYSYPAGALVGQLTGFNEPQGLCVDPTGNVFITNTLNSNILKYAHGGTTPIGTLYDPGEYPVGCSYSKRLNTIAVANIMSTTGGPGSVAVYGNPSSPNIYSDPRLYRVYFLGYDRTYNLFVDGTNADDKFRYAKMVAIGVFYNVKLKAAIDSPAGVQYSGEHKDMAVGAGNGTIYKTLGPNILGTVTISDGCSLGQFSITKSKVIVPEPCNASVAIYPYPAGGSPIMTIREGLTQPVGVALSLQKLQ